MKRSSITLALAALLGATGPTLADYRKDGQLQWTWDGSFLPPVLASPGLDYPSMRMANLAFTRARDAEPQQTIDFAALDPAGARAAAAIVPYACKMGAYDADRHLVRDVPGFIHCMTIFTTADGRKLFKATVNFIKAGREQWDMAVAMKPRQADEVGQPLVIKAGAAD